jgi:hypothetical protein
VCLLVWSFVIEPDQLVVKQYSITLAHWPNELNGFKISLISDLHVGSSHIDLNKVRKVVAVTNETQPDLILLLGDYIAEHTANKCPIEPEKFGPELANLHAKYGVYAILGNHDWWYNGRRVRQALEAANIKVLENSAVKIESNGKPFWLIGIADMWTRKTNITQPLGEVSEKEPVILLSHNPDILPTVPSRVDLVLAGHTHGGQVSLPFAGPMIVPAELRYAKGLIKEDGRTMFVCSGIGTSVLPVRFMVPPEISVLVLSGSNNEK